MTGVRVRATRARRVAILDAALELFLERGFGATTLDHILERSTSSVGSFYHQFDNKADVAAALYLSTLESYQADFTLELMRHRDAKRGVEGAVRHHLKWTGANAKTAAYLTHCREPEVVQVSEARAQKLNQTFLSEVREWLSRHVIVGTIRSLPPQLYYPLWMGPTDEFTRHWLGGEQDVRDLHLVEDTLAEAAWTALSGAAQSAARTRRPSLKAR